MPMPTDSSATSCTSHSKPSLAACPAMSAILIGPAELAFVLAPDDEPLQKLTGAHDDVAGLADRLDHRARPG